MSWVLAVEAREARAKRRALQAVEPLAIRVEPSSVREILEAFERGDDNLHGYPRRLVNFDAIYRSQRFP